MTESSVDGPDSTIGSNHTESMEDSISTGDIERERMIASWRLKVLMYRDSLVSVRPILLMRKMKILNTDHPQLENIFQLDIDNRRTEAFEHFINYLLHEDGLDRNEVADRWKSFAQALQEVNDWVFDIVQGVEDPSKHELQKNLIQYFTNEICDNVDPQHLLLELRPLLGSIEYETLCSTLMNSGPTLAVYYMVGHLPHSTDRNWLRKFQLALMRNGYAPLAEMLDDKGYASLMRDEIEDGDGIRRPNSSVNFSSASEGRIPIQRVSRGEEIILQEDGKGSMPLKTPVPVADISIHRTSPTVASTLLSPLMKDVGLRQDEVKDGNEIRMPNSPVNFSSASEGRIPMQRVSRGEEESIVEEDGKSYRSLKRPVPVADISIHQTSPKVASTSLSPQMRDVDIGWESSEGAMDDEKSLLSVLNDAPPLTSMGHNTPEELGASIAKKLDPSGLNRYNPETQAKPLLAKDIADLQDNDQSSSTSNARRLVYSSEQLRQIGKTLLAATVSKDLLGQLHAFGIARNSGDNSNAEVGEDGEGEMEEEEVGEIELRPYQVELARRPLLGQNVIICAPTGSGKTQVALKIMQEHLRQQGQGVLKTVFLVNQVALAEQQYKQCVRHLKGFRCKCVTGNTGDAERVPLKHLLIAADVLVMTAQLLLDALDNKELDSICQFSLIVFDECHHTNQRHPFNCIMHHYMAVKYSPEDVQPHRLPQVVGLTASVGVGKANKDEQACNHIRKLCAHLDAVYLCTVRHEIQELARFTNEPKYDQYICLKRDPDLFLEIVENIMRNIEERLLKPEYRDRCSEIADKLNPPRQRGTSQYTGWAAQLRKEVAKLRDPWIRRVYESARRMLEFYNTSLVINDECDTEDAFTYLEKQIRFTYDSIGNKQEEVDVWLKDLFTGQTARMEEVGQQQANTNPKLIRLEQLIVKAFQDEPESRAIVFVKTRDLASALLHWMRRRPNLLELKPGKMVGAGASAESGGMTKNQQVDVMQFFQKGDHKVMIATSVAEEGLDIRKCNLVIRYNHVTNEIAMVQARGRARAENSKFVTLAGEDRGVQAKDEINFIREMMMRDAIKQLQIEMDHRPEEFRQALEQIQREEKTSRDIELQARKGRQLREGEVDFRCRKCDEFAFMSSDVRKIEKMHHVVIDLDFRERHTERPIPRETFGNIETHGRLLCKNCGDEWGTSILFRRTKFPVVAASGFVVTDEFGSRDAPKKWKQVKCYIKPLESEELEAYQRQAAAVGYTDD